jgi:hypothetical protein
MLNAVLQKNDDATVARINPKGVSIRRCPLKSLELLINSMIFIDRVQADT